MTMQEAVNAPRFHHQWLPDEIRMESGGFDAELKLNLEKLGYIISEQPNLILGSVNGVLIHESGLLEGGSDQRRGDKAVGF